MKEFESNQMDELKDASRLRSLKKQPFFEEPEGYFDRLPDILHDRLDERDPVESAPLLSELERKSYFQAPEGYFEEMASRIGELTYAAEPAVRIRSLWDSFRKPQYSLSVAAVVLLFILGVWVAPRQADSLQPIMLDSEELLAMVDVDDMDTEILVEILGEESLNEIDFLDNWEISDDEVDELMDEIDLDAVDPSDIW